MDADRILGGLALLTLILGSISIVFWLLFRLYWWLLHRTWRKQKGNR